MNKIPIIDIGSYIKGTHHANFIEQLRDVCKNIGFFYVSNHQVPRDLEEEIMENTKIFFEQPKEEKVKIHMKNGGRAWRGYFQLGQQYTSGKIDLKEGLYLGEQLDQSHPKVKAKTPLHGSNLFPSKPEKLKENILRWQKHMTQLGYHILQVIAESLGLDKHHFKNTICKEHLGLLRLFHYPVDNRADPSLWAVGEHTDYGLITMLLISDKGLEVKNKKDEWVKIDPIKDTFVINIGDILERITGGLYKSTPHRARNTQETSRYSIPYFFDPDWDSEIKVLDIQVSEEEKKIMEATKQYRRWDEVNLTYLTGIYGNYLLGKVSKVFPQLASQAL